VDDPDGVGEAVEAEDGFDEEPANEPFPPDSPEQPARPMTAMAASASTVP
jgi:hypothetical protein